MVSASGSETSVSSSTPASAIIYDAYTSIIKKRKKKKKLGLLVVKKFSLPGFKFEKKLGQFFQVDIIW